LIQEKGRYYRRLKLYRYSIRIARRRHTRRKLNVLQGSSKKMWSFVNEISGRSTPSSSFPSQLRSLSGTLCSSAEVPDVLAKHFASVGELTVSSINNPDIVDIETILSKDDISPGSYFQIDLIDPQILMSIIRLTNVDYKNCISSVPSKVIKNSMHFLATPLAFIFNLSIRAGVYPSEFKLASVIPLYKGKGSKSEPSNYRPISLTSYLSKLFEKCVKVQVDTYLTSINFLSDFQYGFRSHRSCELALSEMTDTIARGCEGGNAVIGVLIDISKAFDCVNHDILLRILKNIGFSDSSVSWFNSYLQGRLLSIVGPESSSSSHPLSPGGPQGSVLGPLSAVDCTILSRVGKKTINDDIAFLNNFLT